MGSLDLFTFVRGHDLAEDDLDRDPQRAWHAREAELEAALLVARGPHAVVVETEADRRSARFERRREERRRGQQRHSRH